MKTKDHDAETVEVVNGLLDEIERMRDLLADVREHLTRTWFSWHVQQSAATALLKRIDAVLEGRK